jgi:hypothetical protein
MPLHHVPHGVLEEAKHSQRCNMSCPLFHFNFLQVSSWKGIKKVRMPGVEPGAQAWGACMLLLHYMRHAEDAHYKL